MKDSNIMNIINKIFINVFDRENNFTKEEILDKFAFDIKLPKKVYDSITNEVTWADSINSGKFITLKNMEKKDIEEGWMLKRKEFSNLKELIDIWNSINLTTTERVSNSINVSESDTTYDCENVYRSTGCSNSKNVIYCDSCINSEYILASSRSITCSFCIRVDDSKDCTNSYSVIWSNKVSNSLFIQDCFNLYECIFCSHIANKRFCIANMQFEEDEYYEIKNSIISWILQN